MKKTDYQRLEGNWGDLLVQPSCSKHDQLKETTQECVQLSVYISLLLRVGKALAELDTVLTTVVTPVLNHQFITTSRPSGDISPNAGQDAVVLFCKGTLLPHL